MRIRLVCFIALFFVVVAAIPSLGQNAPSDSQGAPSSTPGFDYNSNTTPYVMQYNKRDIPGAEVRFLDTGHFALETHAREIAAEIRKFLAGWINRDAA